MEITINQFTAFKNRYVITHPGLTLGQAFNKEFTVKDSALEKLSDVAAEKYILSKYVSWEIEA